MPNIRLRDIEDTRDASGPVVVEVRPGSPEERAGIQRGDAITEVVTRIEDTPVKDIAELNAVMRKLKPGERVGLRIKRGEKEVPVTVEVR